MAFNSELSNQRCFRRSMSESIREENLSYDDPPIRRMSRKSECQNDNQELEEIVTCPIHLGIMDDPRKLFCQHAFCFKCLKDYAKSTVDLICPICRVRERNADIDKLPPALTEKQLIDVVMKYRLNRCAEESQLTMPLSDDRKEELVKHLLKEINSKNGIYKVTNTGENFIGKSLDDSIHVTSYAENTNTSSRDSLTYDMMDIETIRENMLKHSQYEVVKRESVKKLYKLLYKIRTDNVQLDFSIFDINISNNHPRLSQLVLVNRFNNQLIVYSESQLKTFHIYLGGSVVKAEYIRIFRGDLIISGRLEKDETFLSVFLRCTMNGKLIHQSELYTWPNLCSLPMILGFDINEKENKFYLCMPQNKKVCIYNTFLEEYHQSYEFDDNQPEYIAYSPTQNQLWVSCPSNKRILIFNIDSGMFRLFNTEQINKAIPKMIFVTDDEKVLFLDTKGNRFIWIKRRNEYILTQKLNSSTLNRDFIIKTFQVLPFSAIIVGFESEILIFQSVRSISRSCRVFELCNLL